MNSRLRITSLILLLLSSCTLPGAISPTPFAFPTANLTLTQVLAPTSTITPLPPTQAILESISATAPVIINSPTQALFTSTNIADLDARPNGTIIRVERLLDPPTIDGDLTDWTQAIHACAQVTYGTVSWSGELDASASFQLAWDNDNLYLAVEVTDDSFVQISSGKYLFRGDSIEIQLDSDLTSDFTSSVLNSDDFQLGFTPGNFNSLPSGIYRWFPVSLAGPLLNADTASVETAIGYILEASVPWSTFGMTPEASDTFGFALSISDNDSAGTAIQQSLISSVSTRVLTDPTTWGTLILVDAPD